MTYSLTNAWLVCREQSVVGVWWGSQTHYYHLLAAQLHLEVQEKNPFPPLCMLKMGQVPFEYLEDLLLC